MLWWASLIHLALVPEIVLLGLLLRLVVPSQKKDLIWVASFQGEKISHALGPMHATIDIVAKKHKLLACTAPALLSQHLNQVVELAMDVAKDDYLAVDPQ